MFMPAPCSLALPGMVEEAKEKREDTYIPYSAEVGIKKRGGRYWERKTRVMVSKRAAGLEYWKKDMLDFSYFTEREGNDSQRLVRVEKVRQKWRESGLVLEQTDLKAIGQDWRSWSVEGGEEEVARWVEKNAAIFEGGLVMGYPEWICHICDGRSAEPLSTRL